MGRASLQAHENMGLDMMDKKLALAAVTLGSLIEMWAAAVNCDTWNDNIHDCKDEEAWAVACGAISLIICIVLAICMKFKPDIVEGIVGQICFFLLFCLWVAGMAVGTFQRPFSPGPMSTGGVHGGNYGIAGNGYFATWLCLVFSTILVIVGVPPISSVLEPVFGSLDDCKKMMLAIFLASIIEMWHAARICDKSYKCEGMLAWGVAAGAASAGLILIFALLQKFVPAVEGFTKFFALFLALWWLSAVCSLTMPNNSDCEWDDYYCKGLFTSVSNGFCGCWVAMIFSVMFACDQFGVSSGGGGGGGGGTTKESNPSAESRE